MALTTHQPKVTPHHKKSRGAHHRQSKHYLKTYYPYLPLLLIVMVGLAVNIFWSARTEVLGATTNLTATSLLTDTNNERLRGHEDQLQLNAKLSAAAQSKANDMAAKNYWSHTSPDGRTPWKFIAASGYDYYTAGENLAYGFSNAENTVAGWMNSREHRDNVLNPDYTEVGFGIVPADNFMGHGRATIVVAMYAEPAITSGNAVLASTTATLAPHRNVSRVQLLTQGQAPWSVTIVGLVGLLAAAWFLVRHFKIWKRVVVESEEFVVRHPVLDVLIITIAIAGFVLTRSAGFIQ